MKLDIITQLGAITRAVHEREHEGQPARAVVASRTYATTVEGLWDAITSPERIPRWFLPVCGELRLGGRYQLQGNAGGTITRCEPPHQLALTWEFGGQVTWVRVQLRPEADGAHLELEHIAPVGGDPWDQYGPGAVGKDRSKIQHQFPSEICGCGWKRNCSCKGRPAGSIARR